MKKALAPPTLAAVVGAASLAAWPGAGVAQISPEAAGVSSTRASVAGAQGVQHVHLFPSASDPLRQGFVRVINRSAAAGRVRIVPVDDAGRAFDPLTLAVGSRATAHFNSDDLENGNEGKGLTGRTGAGQGDWRLAFSGDVDIEVLAYVRTVDGFLTAMHDLAPRDGDVRRVAFFNPGSNRKQVSRLRLVNPTDAAADVTIRGTDDRGRAGAGEVTLSLDAGTARGITAAQLESGAAGLVGRFGDGAGKWRLAVESEQAIVAMNLLESPTDHLTNLSTVPRTPADGTHRVPLFPAAGDASGRQGFVRVINRSPTAGEVRIAAFDGSDRDYGALTLSIGAGEAAHFNSDDLEQGSAEKGLSGGTGAGKGDWRLELESDLDLEVLAYIRAADGFLTSMHDIVPSAGNTHRVAIFNPASNTRQVSLLRLVNAGPAADVTIAGRDDRGDPGEGEVVVRVPSRGSTTVDARALESGGEGLTGTLGDGAGKWRLTARSDRPVVAMSLLQSPTGHLTNLSGVGDGGARAGTGVSCEAGGEGASGTGSGARASFGFPDDNAAVNVVLDDPPITTQIASGGTETGTIAYATDNRQVATVDGTCGVVALIGVGRATITATRRNDAGDVVATASYVLTVYRAKGGVVDTQVIVGETGTDVETVVTYESGLVEHTVEIVGGAGQFGGDVCAYTTSTRVLFRIRWRTLDGSQILYVTTCTPTAKDFPDLPPIDPEELGRRLTGAQRFTPRYIDDHGAVVDTTREELNTGWVTTTEYASGWRVATQVEEFREGQRRLDYNGNGDDVSDFVWLREVAWDRYLHSRELRILTERGGEVLEDFGKQFANTPRRVAMPSEDIPAFLRFHGPVDDIVVHIAEADTDGHYHVKVDSNDPTVRLIVTKDGLTTLRPDHFARVPRVEDAAEAVYVVYAVDGPLHRNPLPEYPNFWVRHDRVNWLVPTLLKGALDGARDIVERANLPAYLRYFDAVRVEYDPALQGGSNYGVDGIRLAPAQVYAERPLIHEASHGYHDNVLAGGFENADVKALYARVPSDTSVRFGDEQNSYWRTNELEFFAEGLTTYIYLESGLEFEGFDPISQVDSTFYHAELKPYFDELFGR